MAAVDLSDGIVFASAARTQPNSPFTSKDLQMAGSGGVRIRFKITAAGGTTPTLDLKLQAYDAAAAEWFDLTDSAGNVVGMAQKTGTGNDTLMLHTGTVEKLTTTFRKYSIPLPRQLRVVVTGGADADETYTFSVSGERLA